MDWTWFNVGAPIWVIRFKSKRIYVRLWNLFNRVESGGQHWWGFGVLQINNRHLFYIGYNSVSIAFIGRSK